MATNNLSIQKTVVLLVFICAAVMMSLFVVHLRKTPVQFVSDNVTLLPVPRDISNFELLTADREKFTLKNFRNHWSLILFGFTHCATVCPITLEMLKNIYPELQQQYRNLQVVFVSLDPERDSFSQLKSYTQNFHSNFIGITGKIDAVHKIQQQFGVFSGRDQSNQQSNYQIQHTPSIFLVNPNGKLSAIFTFGMNADVFKKTFIKSMDALQINQS